MNPDRWHRIDKLFHAVLSEPPDGRVALLHRLCPADWELRAEVQALLTAHEDDSNPFDSPAFLLPAQARADDTALIPAGQRIGGYRLLGILGRGGSSIVYEAEQDSPRRTIALKLFRSLPHLDELTPRLFQRETQALARLDHPGIGAIYDAGQADASHYFAMERIAGAPLTTYAREHALSLRARLELFRHVCDAVHYAHQRGVIHRDLKPSNILVTSAGRPKVLDFGLARIAQPDADVTRVTEAGAFHGTIAYASPEQVCGRIDAIDLRADVYSLGVILYELLTGRLPYEVAGLPLTQAARIISDQLPRAPGALVPELRGDVETIVLKALAKEPERRYESAAALAGDIERYLDRLPILARPPSLRYVLGKFLGRHRLASSLAFALLLIVLASAGLTSWLALRFADQRNRAREAQSQASAAAAAAEQFASFLENVFLHADAGSQNEDEPSLRQVLDEGYEKLGQVADPLARARLMLVMGGVYTRLDQIPRARELLEGAVAIRRMELGNDHPQLAEALLQLGQVPAWEGGDSEKAHAALSEALEIRRRVFGDDHTLVAEAWNRLGKAKFYAGDHAVALTHFSKCLEIARHVYPGPHADLADCIANVGRTYDALGQTAEAEQWLRESLQMCRDLNDPVKLEQALEGLALLVWKRDHAETERIMSEELEVARRAYHEHHPRLAWVLGNYAFIIAANRGPAQAEPHFREAVAICRASGKQGMFLARSLDMLGNCLNEQHKYAEAIEPLREAVAIWTRLHGPDHALTNGTQTKLDTALAVRQ